MGNRATCSMGIKDFKVGNLLSKGSFEGIYRAESIHSGLEVAIKMIDKAMYKAGTVQSPKPGENALPIETPFYLGAS